MLTVADAPLLTMAEFSENLVFDRVSQSGVHEQRGVHNRLLGLGPPGLTRRLAAVGEDRCRRERVQQHVELFCLRSSKHEG